MANPSDILRNGLSLPTATPNIKPREMSDPTLVRQDGTQKGLGYFGGALKTHDNRDITEYSMGIDFGQGEMQIPTIVPTLTDDELNHLRAGGAITPSIRNKAVAHARMRLQNKLSPFAD